MWVIPKSLSIANEIPDDSYVARADEAHVLEVEGLWHREENPRPETYWKKFLRGTHAKIGGPWVEYLRGRFCRDLDKAITRRIVGGIRSQKGRREAFVDLQIAPGDTFRPMTSAEWRAWQQDHVKDISSRNLRRFRARETCAVKLFVQSSIPYEGTLNLSSGVRFDIPEPPNLDLNVSCDFGLDESFDVKSLFVKGIQRWTTPVASGDSVVSRGTKERYQQGEKIFNSPLAVLVLGNRSDAEDYYLNPRFVETIMGIPIGMTNPYASSIQVTKEVSIPCSEIGERSRSLHREEQTPLVGLLESLGINFGRFE